MAWLTREDARTYSKHPKKPDMETLSYWLARLEPLIRADTLGEIIVVLANRCGTEDDAVYAGTSAVLGIHEGEVKVYGILGCGEKELLVVDTNDPPQVKLVSDGSPQIANPNRLSKEIVSAQADSAASSKAMRSAANGLIVNTHGHHSKFGTSKTPISGSTDIDDGEDYIMSPLLSPLSPVDPKSPTQFFHGPKTPIYPPKDLRSSLQKSPSPESIHKSAESIDEPPIEEFYRSTSPIPRVTSRRGLRDQQGLAIFEQEPPPDSPVTRNTSRMRHLDQQDMELFDEEEADLEPMFEAPIFRRPSSPKSRNTSRTGFREPQEPEPWNHDLTEASWIASLQQHQDQRNSASFDPDLDEALVLEDSPGSPHFLRSPSPLPRDTSRMRHRDARVPESFSPDFKEGTSSSASSTIAIVIDQVPHSASAIPYPPSSIFCGPLGPGRRHTPPLRPKSTNW